MPKLAIYVSKQDMKSIERWRKRINFSKVFIHAVFEEIRRLERSADTPEDKLAAAADYYRSKLTSSAGPQHDFGFELGAAQVLDCDLEPETIRKLLDSDSRGVDGGSAKQVLAALGKNAAKVEEYGRQHGLDDKTNPAWRSAVYGGYLDGVAAAWDKVCAHMRDVSA